MAKLTKKEMMEELEGKEFYYADVGMCECSNGKIWKQQVPTIHSELRCLPKRVVEACLLSVKLNHYPDPEDKDEIKLARKGKVINPFLQRYGGIFRVNKTITVRIEEGKALKGLVADRIKVLEEYAIKNKLKSKDLEENQRKISELEIIFDKL